VLGDRPRRQFQPDLLGEVAQRQRRHLGQRRRLAAVLNARQGQQAVGQVDG